MSYNPDKALENRSRLRRRLAAGGLVWGVAVVCGAGVQPALGALPGHGDVTARGHQPVLVRIESLRSSLADYDGGAAGTGALRKSPLELGIRLAQMGGGGKGVGGPIWGNWTDWNDI